MHVVRQDAVENVRGGQQNAGLGDPTRQRPPEALGVFAHRPPTKAFNLKLSFAKTRASRDDVIEALEAILRELRKAT